MAATKRLAKELNGIQTNKHHLYIVKPDEENMLIWNVILYPDSKSPYGRGAFEVVITYPAEYPFKPPKIVFKTLIYHPNIDEKGQICLPIISAENWKPATKSDQVLDSLMQLIATPEPEHPLRPDLAEEYSKDPAKFKRNAEDCTKKHALSRNTIKKK